MPANDWNQDATWNLFYGARVAGESVTYGRAWAYSEPDGHDPEDSHFAKLRDRLVALGVQPGDRVLVVGCGFGYLIDRFHAAGFPLVWGIDNSEWIDARKGVEAADGVVWVEDDIQGGGRVRAALRQLTGANTFRWVVTEAVVMDFDDQDLPGFYAACDTVTEPGGSVVHFVMLPPFAERVAGLVNEKVFAEWVATRPDHRWLSDEGDTH